MLFFVSGSGNMIARGQQGATDPDALEFRRKALRDAVMCIAWLKFASLLCFILLYALVVINNKGGFMAKVLQYMLIVVFPVQIIHGFVLFFGAYKRSIPLLKLGIVLFIAIGVYFTILGLMGLIHYIKTGNLTMHFILAIIFLILAMDLITIILHDVFIIYSYIRFLNSREFEESENLHEEHINKPHVAPKSVVKNV